jgi:arylsulfatase A-like enzyme
MSIMTSLYPSVHKLQGYPKPGRLDDSVVTLAQVLKANGYYTVSFNGGGYVNKAFGFDRGFDVYDSPSRDDIEKTNNATFNWLSENRDQKFFLFFHTYATHIPYAPPASYRQKFFPDYNESTDKKYELEQLGKVTINDDEIWKVIALYDGEINYVDHEMGRLLETLDYLNLSNNTIVIFTSDHGDELLEHGWFAHVVTSYQEIIHVPLIIRFPGIKNSRIKNLAQSIDIMPTILDSLNITTPSQVQGVSLLPLIKEGKNVNSYAYSEGADGYRKAIIDENLTWKYIYNVKNKKEELYNLENDPLEQNNLIDESPEVAENLREELSRWMEENERLAESYSSSEAELKNETKEALKALGYVV